VQCVRRRGVIVSDPCQTCHGETRVTKEVKLNVKVPPGVEDGTRIRYSGRRRRRPVRRTEAAIYISCFRSARMTSLSAKGNDLHCVIPISFPQAALGAEIEIPAIDGAGDPEDS
jgi:molecular chaperone DnaJ